MVKTIKFKNSNLYLNGFGMDTNGNSIVKLGFPNARGFSIQTNGVLPHTNRMSDKNWKKGLQEITYKDLALIEKECVNYIKSYGSILQKKKLKTYSK
jgi:hypothetical protein